MKKNLTILEINNTNDDGTPKTTKGGKSYARYKTEDGWLSCFNAKAIEELNKCLDKNVSVEVAESGEYMNITKFYGVENDEVKVEKPFELKERTDGTPRLMRTMPKDPVGLAVEIFCTLFNTLLNDNNRNEASSVDVMKASIELVKQAQEAFS